MKVLSSGYVSMDHIIKINTPAKIGRTSIVTNKTNTLIYYGGCSVNIAAALCKLGIQTMPLLRVGGDYESNGFKAFLNENEIPTEGIKVLAEEVTSTCYLIQDNDGNHITIYYPGAMDNRYSTSLSDALFEDCSYGVITVAAKEDNQEFYRQCKKHKIPIAFGMKADFNAFPKEFLWELLCNSQIIFTNEAERAIIEEMYYLRSMTDLFADGKADMIITTYGKDGSRYEQRTSSGVLTGKTPACKVEEVVDATGAGDAYISGFLYGHFNGEGITTCCQLGSALSAFVLEKEGCCTNFPSQEELYNRTRK